MADENQTIIIKKIKKGGHGHHGGAWKVAYADFVTAMMAFFLLMWLLNSTTQEQKEGISNYFAPSSISESTSGSGGLLAGASISEISAMQSAGIPPVQPAEVEEGVEVNEADSEDDTRGAGFDGAGQADESREEENEAIQRARDAQNDQFEDIQQKIRKELADEPALKDLLENLMMEITPEGLRIQIVDQDKRAMFTSGSAAPQPHTRALMAKVSAIIAEVPNAIAITGHTDSVPYPAGSNYTNWDLSADRAQSMRRMLVGSGVLPARIAYVSGRAYRDPLIKDDPKNPANRRVSITLMYQDLEKPLVQEDPIAPIKDGVLR